MKPDTNELADEKIINLRREAEKLRENHNLPEVVINTLEDAQRLITELQIHQIELEMQKEELNRSQVQLAMERKKYADLYNSAPVAYFTFDQRDIILDLNLSAANLLGAQPKQLLNRPFTPYLTSDSLQVFIQHRQLAMETGQPQTCELSIRPRNGPSLCVETRTIALPGETNGKQTWRTVMSNIDERKRAENVTSARLRITEFAAEHSIDELLQNALDELCELTNSSVGFLHYVEADQQTLSLQAWSTRTLREMCNAEGRGRHYNIKEAGVWVDCVHERRPVIHNDYASLPHRKGMPQGHAPIVREMVFPIIRKQLIVAIIGVGNKLTPYTEEDTTYAMHLADLLWDIIERKRTEVKLLEKEVQYENLADSGLALIWTSGTDKLCNYFNQPWLNFTGRTMEQEMGNGWAEGVHPDDFERCLQTYITKFERREAFEMEYRLKHHSGEYRWIQDLGTPNYNSAGEFVGYIGHCFDITERKQVEAKLRATLVEKELLLRELNHRTKNNLNIINSLISIQASRSESAEFQALANSLEKRIQSISLVHQMLYQSASLSQIDLGQYAREIVSHLMNGLEISPGQIEVVIESSPVSVGINAAIPCGQILNELILNALKYAFPGGRQGKLTIQVHQAEDGEVVLGVSDNGVGIPPGVDEKNAKSLGMMIIRNLTGQLNGTLSIESQDGFSCKISFKENAQVP
jgi:PAS domain S-box-containing protein